MDTLDTTTLHTILRDVQARAPGGPPSLAALALPLLNALHHHDDQDEVGDLLVELVGKEHRKTLRRALRDGPDTALRSLDDDPPLRAACQALVAALDGGAAAPARARSALLARPGV